MPEESIDGQAKISKKPRVAGLAYDGLIAKSEGILFGLSDSQIIIDVLVRRLHDPLEGIAMETLDQAASRLIAAIDEALDAAATFDRLYVDSMGETDDKYEIMRKLQECYAKIDALLGASNNE